MSLDLTHLISRLPIAALIGRFCPFNNEELEWLAKNGYNFEDISYNHEISWTPLLVNKLKDVLNWNIFSFNGTVPWGDVIPGNSNRIWWECASYNSKFSWKDKYLYEYSDLMDWDLLSHQNLPFSVQLISDFLDKWNWQALSSNESLPWSSELIKRFSHLWDWPSLSHNAAIPFTGMLLEQFHGSWNFKLMSMNRKMVSDEYLPLLQFFTSLDFELISYAKTDFSLKFLDNFRDRLDWVKLCGNHSLPWRDGIHELYAEKMHYFELSGNPNLPWSYEFLLKHLYDWNWNGKKHDENGMNECLSTNENLPWSFDLIEEYLHKWEWGRLEYESFDCWIVKDGITSNRGIKWTVDMMAKYSKYFHEYFFLKNRNFYTAIENEIGRKNVINLYRSL